jgi:RNA polymerase sigma factor (sigma-70 family)
MLDDVQKPLLRDSQGLSMSDHDIALANRAHEGDESALALLLERYGPMARAKLHIPPKWSAVLTADDVMQQAYLEAFLHIDQFEPRGEGAFGAWLSTIATNVLRDAIGWLSAQKRGGGRTALTRRSGDESAVALIETLGVDDGSASQQARLKESIERLHHGIAELPPHYRMVIREFDLMQRPAEQIAADLGGTVGAMYMLRRRAIYKLRELLGSSPGALI